MKQLMLTVKDKTRIEELKEYGNVTYVSDYTQLVGFECTEQMIPLVTSHDIVDSYEDACTGTLQ